MGAGAGAAAWGTAAAPFRARGRRARASGRSVRSAADVATATRFVHVEFFIVAFDDTTRGFFAAMEDAVRRGVRVRLLMDHIASRKVPLHAATIAELDRIGVEWHYLLPVRPLDAGLYLCHVPGSHGAGVRRRRLLPALVLGLYRFIQK